MEAPNRTRPQSDPSPRVSPRRRERQGSRRHRRSATDAAREFCIGLLDLAGVTVDGPEPWDIQVHDERLWLRCIRDRELGLGEAYQDRWWDAPRPDRFLERILCADLRSTLRPGRETIALAVRSTAINRQSRRRAGTNVRSHYDIGNDLYTAMLDPAMVYSCAYWDHVDDLASAQQAKLELICEKLQLDEGMTLLDIGCGWGGLAEHAARTRGARVVGISLSPDQVEVARARVAGLDVEIRLQDYRDVSGTFDRIVSVGMMEHVGPRNLDALFATCDHLLTPDGLMLHHTIGSNESKRRSDPWFDKYIFPGGVLPSMEQIARAARRRWVIEDVHNFGPHYDRTLMAWYANIEAAWPDLPHYDERFRRTWRYYLLASAAAFRVRDIQLWQIVFRRAGRVSPVYRAIRSLPSAGS